MDALWTEIARRFDESLLSLSILVNFDLYRTRDTHHNDVWPYQPL